MRATLQSVVLACAVSLQQPADLGAYRQIIDAYRDGVALHGERVVSGAGGFSIVSRAVDPANGWTAADLAAAAMFHTEMALRLAKVSRQPDPVAHVEAATGSNYGRGRPAPPAESPAIMELAATTGGHVLSSGARTSSAQRSRPWSRNSTPAIS